MRLVYAPPPSAADKPSFAAAAKSAAVTLVSAVRNDSPAAVWEHLRTLNPSQIIGVCIALAAMVPDGRSTRELLAWTEAL